MSHDYLAAGLRNLTCNGLYSLIGITGLAIGLCAALLIALYVRDELSFEFFRPSNERTYLISEFVGIAGANPIVSAASPAELAGWVKGDIPDMEAVIVLQFVGDAVMQASIALGIGTVVAHSLHVVGAKPAAALHYE